jgi:hypothetical protein
MHSLHFIRLKAESPEDAFSIVENHLYDWGDENNWFSVLGCITPNNEVFSNSNKSLEDFDTIDKINNLVNEWLTHNEENINSFELIKTKPTKASWTDWRNLRAYADLESYRSVCGGSFNIFQDVLFEGDYDCSGVSSLYNETDNENLFVVFIDMHS